jgi:hypothetical protein
VKLHSFRNQDGTEPGYFRRACAFKVHINHMPPSTYIERFRHLSDELTKSVHLAAAYIHTATSTERSIYASVIPRSPEVSRRCLPMMDYRMIASGAQKALEFSRHAWTSITSPPVCDTLFLVCTRAHHHTSTFMYEYPRAPRLPRISRRSNAQVASH